MKNSIMQMKSWFGKTVRRFAKEDKGQTMMEYVIIAVLIAAACTAAVIYFGRQNANQIAVAIKASSGDATGAKELQEKGQTEAEKNANAAKEAAEKFGKTN